MKIAYEFSEKKTLKEELMLQVLFFERWRYKILWQLRDLEVELKLEENGLIVIPALDKRFQIEVRGFSEDVTDKILMRFTSFCKSTLILNDK